MKQVLLCILIVSAFSTAMAQTTNQTDNKYLYEPVERLPEFPGGKDAFQKYIQKNLEDANMLDRKVMLFVKLVVEKDGSITNVELVRGVGRRFDKALIKLIEQSPKWKPATFNHKVKKDRLLVPLILEPSK